MTTTPAATLPAEHPHTPAELTLLRLVIAEQEVHAASLAALNAVAALQAARIRLSSAQMAVIAAGVVASPGANVSQ